MTDQPAPKPYHRRKLAVRLVLTVLGLAYFLAWCYLAQRGVPALAHHINSRWLVLIIFAVILFGLLELLTLPLSIYIGYLLEHRFDLSNQTPRDYLTTTLKQWAVGGILGLILLLGLYALLWYGGRLWWLWTWCAWVALLVLLTRLLPTVVLPIFYKTSPLKDDALRDRLIRLAAGSDLQLTAVQSFDLSKETKKANAALVGLGRSRRVLLSDTLLDGFDHDQIAVVFAHELAHHRRGHIPKLLLLSALTSTVSLAVVLYPLARYAGPAPADWPAAAAALPQVCLAASLVGLLLQPLLNAFARRFEIQADLDALTLTHDPHAFSTAMHKLAQTNLADPQPHPFVEWYFYDHPALARRIALADRFTEHAESPA